MKQKGVIASVCAIGVCAGLLFVTSTGLSTLAATNAQKEEERIMSALLPGSGSFKEVVYDGTDSAIRSVFESEIGFVIETTTAGYAGDVALLTGVDKNGKVTGVVVRDMAETYGLGMQVLNDVNFLAQFLGTSGEAEIGTTVDAISGATVTSKAVTKGVNSAVAFVTGADVTSSATTWGG